MASRKQDGQERCAQSEGMFDFCLRGLRSRVKTSTAVNSDQVELAVICHVRDANGWDQKVMSIRKEEVESNVGAVSEPWGAWKREVGINKCKQRVETRSQLLTMTDLFPSTNRPTVDFRHSHLRLSSLPTEHHGHAHRCIADRCVHLGQCSSLKLTTYLRRCSGQPVHETGGSWSIET